MHLPLQGMRGTGYLILAGLLAVVPRVQAASSVLIWPIDPVPVSYTHLRAHET